MNERRSPSARRRVLPFVALAAGGTALWASLDGSSATTLRVDARPPAGLARGTATTVVTTTPTPSAPSSQPTTASAPTTTAATTTAATNASTVCSHPTRVDGPVVDTRWGPVQVRAQVGNGDRVCSADAIEYPNERERSLEINDQAVPWIDDEVKTQGVNFDAIGGATYTSDGYRESLQAILDRGTK